VRSERSEQQCTAACSSAQCTANSTTTTSSSSSSSGANRPPPPTTNATGPLHVDTAVYEELRATGAFDAMSVEEDEAEHSLELHAPFIAAAMG